MKQLVIISGKGGTGKTIISASLAALTQKKVMADCDVDAANLYLLLHPEILEEHDFSGGKKANLDLDTCTGCGDCLHVCRFAAIEETDDGKVAIDPISCEGCAVCSYICPVEAISMEERISGKWFVSQTKYGQFVHARLGIGEENSGKLVAEVRKKANAIAESNGLDLVIIDGPPGIGCPVIASLSGTDTALVVTEPTLSGIHDMQRVIKMIHHFNTRAACCINKFDLNRRLSDQIEEWCENNSVPVVGRIPFDEVVTKSLVQGIPVVEFSDNSVTKEIRTLWERLSALLTPRI
ncbi:MAG: ATP-binding protein [Candidatus Aminicenantes bacterium]|nr:ATP-binding protein [Candidatus Aminicenantes bacterium]